MALTKSGKSPQLHGSPIEPGKYSLPVKADAVIYAGALVCIDATGFAVPGITAAGLIAVGRAESDVDNSGGANGAKNVEVTRGVFRYRNSEGGDEITQADLLKEVFIVDDETVAKLNGGATRSRAGTVFKVEGSYVHVFVGPATTTAVAAVESTLASATLQKKSVVIGHADLSDDDGSQSFNLGTALPANAVVVASNVNVTEGFTDGASGAFTLDVGVSGATDAIIDGVVLGSIAQVYTAGARPVGRYAGQLLATVAADVDVDTATAGSVTVEVFYFVLA